MMKEAQKLMQDPAFQAHMKKMMESSGFQTHMKKQAEAMKDPKKLKEMERKAQAAIKDGEEQLKRMEADRDDKKEGGGDDDKEEEKKDGDAEKKSDRTEEEEEVPDIPSLSLN